MEALRLVVQATDTRLTGLAAAPPRAQLQGVAPTPRFDHSAYIYPITPNSSSYDKLVIMGGRDLTTMFQDSHMLDLNRMAWEETQPSTLPYEICNNVRCVRGREPWWWEGGDGLQRPGGKASRRRPPGPMWHAAVVRAASRDGWRGRREGRRASGSPRLRLWPPCGRGRGAAVPMGRSAGLFRAPLLPRRQQRPATALLLHTLRAAVSWRGQALRLGVRRAFGRRGRRCATASSRCPTTRSSALAARRA